MNFHYILHENCKNPVTLTAIQLSFMWQKQKMYELQ